MTDYVGTSGGDVFTGTPNSDYVEGAGGNDTLAGGPDDDVLAGDAGADQLAGGDGADTLYSAGLIDQFPSPWNHAVTATVDSGVEVDTLTGGGGDDTLFAGYGDNVDGGADDYWGDDLYISFVGATSGLNIDFSLDTQVIGGATITDVENIVWVQGGNFDDTINIGGGGSYGAVHGMGGNDHLTTGYYTILMDGGDGNDTLDATNGDYSPTLYGGAGDDLVLATSHNGGLAYGDGGDDVIETTGEAHGGAGDDRITQFFSYYRGYVFGDDGADTIVGTQTELSAIGGEGADVLTGGDYGDLLNAGGWFDDYENSTQGPLEDTGADHDRISGAGGDDHISVGISDDADGGAGTDSLILNLGGATEGVTVRTDLLVGGAAYTLAGGVIQNFEYVERLVGSAYGDVFDVDVPITMSIDGAGGIDTLDFADLAIAAAVTLGLGVDAVGVGPAGSELRHIENVTGTRFGDNLRGSDAANLFVGLDGNDKLYGAGGNDTLEGGAGTDILQGGAGSDLMVGGSGVDIASYSAATAGVAVNLGYTTTQETGGAGIDTLQQVESLGGSAYADTLTGSTGANTLSGAGGDDTLLGGKGSDLLDGGDGGDLLTGGLGDDTLAGGAGSDSASYRDATAGVTVDLAIVAAQDTHGAGIDTLSGIEGLRGSAYGDSLRATDGSNVIDAAEGDDLAWGYAGSDRIAGGLGRDKLWGGDGADRLDGGDGNDVLRGGDGGDRINGDAGIDLIYGDGGIDVLTGGLGADRFVYTAIGDAGIGGATYDRIADFSHAEGDRIDLTAIDAVAGGGDNAFAFAAGGAFTGVAGQLIVTHSGADWLVRGDVNGDAVADFAIQVKSATALVAGDFFL